MTMAGKKNKAHTSKGNDPRKTLIIISDDGNVYRVTNDQWQPLPSQSAQGVVEQLETFGAYVAYVPNDIAVGFGEFCAVLNFKQILQNVGGGSASPSAAKTSKRAEVAEKK
jgi:hypothetical protein